MHLFTGAAKSEIFVTSNMEQNQKNVRGSGGGGLRHDCGSGYDDSGRTEKSDQANENNE
jgi:hypothetical protein